MSPEPTPARRLRALLAARPRTGMGSSPRSSPRRRWRAPLEILLGIAAIVAVSVAILWSLSR